MVKLTVTSNDVAKKAGVSQATVSRVINNYPYIKEATRQKVLSAIDEMGFTPDEVARSLNKRKTGTIGLIVGDIANTFFAETAKIIITEARKKGYDVILTDTNHSSDNLKTAIDTLIGKRVEGIIVGSVERYEEEINRLYASDTPVVLYNTKTYSEKGHSFVLDNVKGAHMAMEHLIGKGHKRIGFATLLTKYSTLYERNIGYENKLEEYNIPYDPGLVYVGDLEHTAISDYIKEIMQGPDPATAVFAASDQMALAIMESCKTMSVHVPGDLAVIGFDNINLAANPLIDLTTISQQHERMSLLAVEKLINLLAAGEKQEDYTDEVIEPILIERSTT